MREKEKKKHTEIRADPSTSTRKVGGSDSRGVRATRIPLLPQVNCPVDLDVRECDVVAHLALVELHGGIEGINNSDIYAGVNQKDKEE